MSQLAQACRVLMHKLTTDNKGGRHCMSRFFLRSGLCGSKEIFSRIGLRPLVSNAKSAKFKSGLFPIELILSQVVLSNRNGILCRIVSFFARSIAVAESSQLKLSVKLMTGNSLFMCPRLTAVASLGQSFWVFSSLFAGGSCCFKCSQGCCCLAGLNFIDIQCGGNALSLLLLL